MDNYNHLAGVVGGGSAVLMFTDKKGKPTPTKTSVAVHTEDKKGEIAAWGGDNNFPQKLLKEVRKNGAATSGLQLISDFHYGGGFVLFQEQFPPDKNGNKKRELLQRSPSEFPEIKEFFRYNNLKRFFRETISDLEYFGIAFPEYILSNDGNKIIELHRQKTAHCRFELANEKTGFIKNVWISSKWGDSVDLKSKFAQSVPLIDSYWPAEKVREHCKKHGIRKFIRPVFYTMLDESYYPVASWHTAYYSKWIQVANSIPEFKKALFENQVNIKYHIEIDEEYFIKKYQNEKKSWEEYSLKDKNNIRKELVKFVDESLRGSKNAGKSIWTMIYKDDNGEHFSGIKITPIDDKLKDGSFLPDASAANSEILFSISVDPTLIGAGIPGGLGAGSGSDKREAATILTARCKPRRETTLETFEFTQHYNGWDDSLIGGFEDTQLTTLDKNPTGSQKAVNI